jgi:hypothetical protein
MNNTDLESARLRFRTILESGVIDPINQFLIAEGLASPTKEVHVTATPPPRFDPPDSWRMPTGWASYPFHAEKYGLPGLNWRLT